VAILLQMAWPNRCTGDNLAIENEADWPCSNTTTVPQPSGFPSQCLLSPNPAIPIWPRTHKIPFTTPSLVFHDASQLLIDGTINPFDGTFEDPEAWRDWDAWENIGEKGDDAFDGASEVQHIRPDSTDGILPQDPSNSNPLTYISIQGSSERASTHVPPAHSPVTEAKYPSLQDVDTGNRVTVASESSKSQSSVPSSSFEPSDMHGLVGIPRTE
jgi:hypothetical protein